MRKTDLAEVKKMEISQIRSKLGHVKLEAQKLKLDKAVFKLTKDIAQMSTILRQKELLAELEKPNDK